MSTAHRKLSIFRASSEIDDSRWKNASGMPYKEGGERYFTIMSRMITKLSCCVANNTRKDMRICEVTVSACQQNPRKHIVGAT